MSKATGTTPNMKTAELIRAYVRAICQDEPGDVEFGAYDLLQATIMETDSSAADAICRMGRALICLHQGLADPAYRIGGSMCDSRLLEIAERLGMEG
jgi:hypothetical protein